MVVRSGTAKSATVCLEWLYAAVIPVAFVADCFALCLLLPFPATPAPAVQSVPPTYESFFLLLMAMVIPPVSF